MVSYQHGFRVTTAGVSGDLVQTLARPRGSIVTSRWARYFRKAATANLFSQSGGADLLRCTIALMTRVLLSMNYLWPWACYIGDRSFRAPVDNLRGRRGLV